MIGIITALLPVIFKLIGWFLDRAKVSAEAKKRFFQFVEQAGKDLKSVKLMEYAEKHLKWFEENPFVES